MKMNFFSFGELPVIVKVKLSGKFLILQYSLTEECGNAENLHQNEFFSIFLVHYCVTFISLTYIFNY